MALAAASSAVALFAMAVLTNGLSPAALAQGAPSLAIDVDPTGNSATILGAREVCVEAESGDVFDIDITVENIEELSAWEIYLGFDNSIVNIVDRDVQMFITSNPGANAFDISASVPYDSDNPYRIGAADLGSPPQGTSGSGVLARLTLEAVGPGSSELSVGLQPSTIGRDAGPTLTDVNTNQIGDSNDDSFFDGPILGASVAVEESCSDSGSEGPIAVLSGGDDGGLAWWIFLAAALGLVATAGIGGIALITLRRANPS